MPEKLFAKSLSGLEEMTICPPPRGGVKPADLEKGSVNNVTFCVMILKLESPYQSMCIKA
jgi:hypothetical protein